MSQRSLVQRVGRVFEKRQEIDVVELPGRIQRVGLEDTPVSGMCREG
jgi:hypothetical protein